MSNTLQNAAPAAPQLSLSTAAARNLATTTKTPPMMQGISPRWLLRVLPFVQVSGGVYRVNRRLSYAVGDGRVSFISTGAKVQVVPQELTELPLLRGFEDSAALEELAGGFVQREYAPGAVIVAAGKPADEVILIAHGKVNQIGVSKYGEPTLLAVLTDGDHVGDRGLILSRDRWAYSLTAVTSCTVLVLPQRAFEQLVERSPALKAHVQAFIARARLPQDKHGQADIALFAGHKGEAELPGTFVDYELKPREYELSAAQTVLRVHTRVADLYNGPMNQLQEQVRLTVEALRERQEYEMINSREFGLLHNADLQQRIATRGGPPTPDDMDDLVSRRRKTRYFLAHPRAIAAFGRECTKRGVYPQPVEVQGQMLSAWRGVPLLPCDKIPISEAGTSSILAMRIGEDDQGVVGLHQTGIPDEVEPSLSVRFLGINDKAILSYLVSAYYSAAVLIPDALGILEDVEVAPK